VRPDTPTAVRPDPAGAPFRRGWLGVHLFYQGSSDLMLRELVLPLVAELRERDLLARYFFLRYWRGGPHVRLRLRPHGDGGAADVRTAVRRHSRGFFATHPSADTLSPEAYAVLARTLGRAEPAGEPDLPLQPNNSLRLAGYRPEHHKYGTGTALASVERHFERSSDLALDLVGRSVPADRRRVLAFGALLAGESDPAHLARRLDRTRRIWAQAASTAADAARDETVYRQRRATLAVVARSMRGPGTTGDPFLDGWRRSVGELWRTLADLEASGRFMPTGPAAAPSSAALPSPATAFAVDNCAHLLCNRLGIGLAEERFLRGLAARAAADLCGEERSE
jgi:hypothetical protein